MGLRTFHAAPFVLLTTIYKMFSLSKKNTLFLDRDGVINIRPPGDYVKNLQEWSFEAGVLEAMPLLAPLFSPIVVVTNQAGVGKGLMSATDLSVIHAHMCSEIEKVGGRIDRVYFCPHLSTEKCACRKPATGMALQALRDFPEINFDLAWMVGDSASDMKLGQQMGMKTVLVPGKFEEAAQLAVMKVDFRFENLLDFARYVSAKC